MKNSTNFDSVSPTTKTGITSILTEKKQETLVNRFRQLDANRTSKLNRARRCASMTIPSLLPPLGWNESLSLPQPYSSIGARGVTSLASRMLSAMLPVNDSPFFRFNLKNGVEATNEINAYLETMTHQVYRKLSSTNLREIVFQAIQSLIVTGDSLVHIEDDGRFRSTRLDHYVCVRSVDGTLNEVIYLEYDLQDALKIASYSTEKQGYEKNYCQIKINTSGSWDYRKEDEHGKVIATGSYEVSPVTVLRWYGIAGDNYGRSHCEDILGDLQSLDSYTKSLLDGMAAASSFWLCLDPSGITEIDDVSSQANGSWIPARKEDLFVLSPSQTMNPQISAAQLAVDVMRREIGQSFLMSGAAIPSGDRVTATAVRMIGSELETILGGAFSAIARDLMEPIIRRTILMMIENDELDKAMYEQFFDKEGTLRVEVVTGLQALSRDSDLQKLMQMGDMVRNLPQEANASFKWSEYAKALITSLGFDNRNWIITEEERVQEQQRLAAEQQKLMQQQAQQQAITKVMANAGNSMAQQDVSNNGGRGVKQFLDNSGVDTSALG